MERYAIVLAGNTGPCLWEVGEMNSHLEMFSFALRRICAHPYCLTSDSWMYVVVLRERKGETTPRFPCPVISYDWASLYYSLSLLKKF